MKKISCLLALIFLLLSGCSNSFSVIGYDDVEKIIVWTHQSERKASEDESSSILEQYNASKYSGSSNGEGGTPEFGVRIYLKNGDEINVNDFSGKVEVITKSKSFYLENQSLYETLKEAALS